MIENKPIFYVGGLFLARKSSFKNKYFIIFLIISSIFVVYWHYSNSKEDIFKASEDYKACVHFVDVGQGDCEIICCEDSVVLIDAGEVDKGKDVVRYLKKLNKNKIDLIVATHPHTDHFGGLIDVINRFDVSKIVMPEISLKLTPTNIIYKKFLNKIKEKKIVVEKAKKGESLNIGGGVIKTLAPCKKNYDKLNDFSIGLLFCYKDISFLFCGDMEKSSEKDLLDSGQKIKADVFKLNHHGSSTSNTKKFLEAVKPKYCVVEVGAFNSYGHPSKNVLNLLSKLGVKKTFRTDKNGTIVFLTDGKHLSFKTEKEGDKIS